MFFRQGVLFFAVAIAVLLGAWPARAQFEFKHHDHVALVGNALADRMQHDGWLETYIQAANAGKELVIRNLGFSGDTVSKRPREEKAPNLEDYLGLVKADVVLAFFGYNESFDQDPEKFKAELGAFIEATAGSNFNGKTPPRIVLFSPIAQEDMKSTQFPDPKVNNKWLSIYTDAMARVAGEKKLVFVDLYSASKAL